MCLLKVNGNIWEIWFRNTLLIKAQTPKEGHSKQPPELQQCGHFSVHRSAGQSTSESWTEQKENLWSGRKGILIKGVCTFEQCSRSLRVFLNLFSSPLSVINISESHAWDPWLIPLLFPFESQGTSLFLCVAHLPHLWLVSYSRHLCKGSRVVFLSFSCDIKNLSSFQVVHALRPLKASNVSGLFFAFEEIPLLLARFLQRSSPRGIFWDISLFWGVST